MLGCLGALSVSADEVARMQTAVVLQVNSNLAVNRRTEPELKSRTEMRHESP